MYQKRQMRENIRKMENEKITKFMPKMNQKNCAHPKDGAVEKKNTAI